MSTIASSPAAPQSAARAVADPPLPDAVVHLQRSMEVLEAAALTLVGRKSLDSKTKENARLLVATGNRLTSAIVAACQHRQGDLRILAKVHVSVARESIDEWTTIVSERGMRSGFASFRSRSDTASQVRTFTLAMQVLVEMMEIENGIAGLVLDPARCLGLSEAKPTSDLPKLSTSLAVYEGFKVVVQGLANMTDGAPWPWKAIPQTVLQFVSMTERALSQPQKVQDLTDKISSRIALLLDVCRRKGCGNEELDAYVESFIADVQRVIIRLRIIERVHSAKAFLLTDHIDELITGEAAKMENALHELQVRFAVHTAYTVESVAAGVAVIQSVTNKTLAMTTTIASTVESTAVTVDATHVMVTEMHAKAVRGDGKQTAHITNRARLPARPSCFKGRMTQLSALVKLVCESVNARIAIMGPGGMGKTSLAKAILHDNEVVNVVQDNRFFLSVEDVIDIESAAKRLAEQLGVGETSDPQSAAISALQALTRSLLVIDNLETLWFSNNAAAQKDTERFLQRLVDVQTLTVIVTSRGSVTPSGIEWTNDLPAELETISLEAAQETFEQIAGRPSLETELAALDELLTGVDCMPLAVTLLAQLARQKNSPSQLLQRWHHSKTTFIRAGGDHRESSVNVSIQISLDLLSAMTGGTEGGQLLSICAHLPDGLRLSVFAQLVTHFSDIHTARDLLVTFALVSVGSNDELRMLSPVRHFVLNRLPMTIRHLAALRKIYFAIAASGPSRLDEKFSQLAKNVAPEYNNLTSFLLHLMGTEEPSQELYDAVDRVSEYSYYTAPSPTLREAFRSRLTTHPAWLAGCLCDLGRTRLARDEYFLAMDNFQAARILYATLGNTTSEARCRQLLGQCLWVKGLLEDAEPELHAARDTFVELGREVDAAKCAMELGDIYIMRGENEQAIYILTSARDTFKRHGNRLYAAQCTRSLGSIQLAQNNLPAAESELQSAMSELQAISDSWGAAQCREILGDVRIRQGDYDSAGKLLVSAKEVYVQLGMKSDLADCHWSFGTLYSDQGRTLEAIESFETARNIYGLVGYQDRVAKCSSRISRLRNAM